MLSKHSIAIRFSYACFTVLLFTLHSYTAFALTPLPFPEGEIILEVHGKISRTNQEHAAVFDLSMLMELPVAELTTTTAVTDGTQSFRGFLMRDLLSYLGATGTTITATALNDYSYDFSIDEFDQYNILAAYQMDGQLLEQRDKGPLWIVYPRDQNLELQDIRYDSRWVWQLKRLDIK